MASANDSIAAALAGALAPVVRAAIADAVAELRADAPRRALLSRSELATELGVCARTIQRLEADGLPVVRVADTSRYELVAVLDWLRARSRPGAAVVDLHARKERRA